MFKCAPSRPSLQELLDKALTPVRSAWNQIELLDEEQLTPEESELRRTFLSKARALLGLQSEVNARFSGQRVVLALRPSLQAKTARWLQNWGLDPEPVPDCPAAYRAALQGNRLGLVLLDEAAEGYLGLGTIQAIRQAGGAPVLVLADAHPSGADGWWPEEQDSLQLLHVLERLLTGRASEDCRAHKGGRLDGQLGRQHPLKILIAEDLALNQKLIGLLLSRLGYPADAASNGYEVMLKVEKEDYDLILMDLNMPGMNGLEAARRVRQLKPLDAGGPRLVAMSANLPNGTPEGSGFEEFLAKPVQLDNLQAVLRNCPQRRSGGKRCLPVLDPGIVDNLKRLGDQEFLESLIDDAAQELPQMLGLLMDCWQRGEAPQVVQLAHAIKGSASTLGAVRVAQLAGELEQQGKTGRLEGDPWAALEAALDEALGRLQN